MLVISSREFREHQKSYFEKVDNGEQVVIQRGKNKSYKLVPVEDDDSLMSKDEFYAKLERSLQQIKEGDTVKLTPKLRAKLFGDL